MINGGPSGFHNAPVTKAFVVATAIFSTALGIRGISSTLLGFSHELIFRKFHSWVLLSSLFAFSSTPELLFGVSLLYYFRVFERQIGSNKHSVFICFTVIVSLVLNVLSLALLKDLVFMPGPYGLIYSSFVPFFFDIPISSRIRIFRIPLSDKSFVYLAGLQLLFSSWKRSLLPGLSGVLAGSLYHFNFLGIRSAKFPETIASFFRRLSWPSLGGLGHTSTSRNFPGSATSNMVHEDVSIPVTAPLMQPPQDSITSLVSMGFDTDSARQALLLAGNDVNLATNILLETR